jgi:replicative DNA helicase
MYQWVRMLSVKYDRPMLATSQISAEGDGLQFPTLGMLKDSKTGKQGAAEFILPIGATNDPNMAGSRFVSLTKNKLHRHGGPKDPRCEVIFDGERGRYRMPEHL